MRDKTGLLCVGAAFSTNPSGPYKDIGQVSFIIVYLFLHFFFSSIYSFLLLLAFGKDTRNGIYWSYCIL